MDDAKLVLVWGVIKLIAAILITAAIASVIYWRIPVYQYVGDGSNEILMYISMSQLTAFLAGLWGYQAISNSHKAADKNYWIHDCRVLNITVAICCFITMISCATILMALTLLGSLLFFILVLQTTITALFIRGRFFLHLLTVDWFLAAHLLFWYHALEIARAA